LTLPHPRLLAVVLDVLDNSSSSSTAASTMKTMHKRLYTALPRPLATTTPRVRSNSASSSSSSTSTSSTASSRALHTSSFGFFDSPPPPQTSRSNGLVVVSRVKPEVESHSHNTPYGQHSNHNNPQSHNQSSGGPPYPLAFTSAQSDASSSHFSINSNHNIFSPYPSFGPVSTLDSSPAGVVDSTQPVDCDKTRYHLDIGAYGIPKHSRDVRVAGSDGRGGLPSASASQTPLQTRSSAVQVGEDAYFVRDNAMGVADGVGGWSKCSRLSHDATPSALFAQRLMHYCSEEVEAANETLEEDVEHQLEDSLEELSDGLDVLMILERAYDKTMRAHVKAPEDLSVPSNPHQSRPESTHPNHESLSHAATATRLVPPTTAPPSRVSVPDLTSSPISIPLREGSATALLAILDHSTPPPPATRLPTCGFGPSFFPPTPRKAPESSTDAVIRIAHLGDCMGMLIRGEDIVWRTEEMWWDFNTPVQLGPQSSTRPQDARVFTVPVQADDILVLATDGLSDNLWDEDILDEVVRFRRSFTLSPYSFPSLASLASKTTASKASEGILGRRTFAGMLSEALCSRARSVSERRGNKKSGLTESPPLEEEEVPFARRAREQGKSFRGGKMDDISVLIAVVSPVEPTTAPASVQS